MNSNRSCLIKIFIILILFALQYCHAKEKYRSKCRLKLLNSKNKAVSLYIETAVTVKKRNLGLMFRKHLDVNRGMIFIFKQEQMLNFWMKNTYIPLSIAYISRKGIINEIHEMKPLDTSITYQSEKPAKYALEVNKGWFKKNSITKGCKIIINGCLSK